MTEQAALISGEGLLDEADGRGRVGDGPLSPRMSWQISPLAVQWTSG